MQNIPFVALPGVIKDRLRAVGYTVAGAQQVYQYYQQYLNNGGTIGLDNFVAEGAGIPPPTGNLTRTKAMIGLDTMGAQGGTLTNVYTKRKKTQKKALSRGGRKRVIIENYVKQMQEKVMCRWQSLTEYVGTSLCAHPFYNHSRVEEPGTFLDLPVYAFNLSAMPERVVGASTLRTIPMYRLVKKISSTEAGIDGPNNIINYTWTGVNKVHGSYQGTNETYPADYVWTKEDYGSTMTSSKYVHDYSDIKLLFQAAKLFQTRVHVQIVSFLNDVGPQRQYTIGGGGIKFDPDLTDPDVIANADLFWDNFLQKKIVHPIAANMRSDHNERNMVVFSNHTIVLPISSTTFTDAAEPLSHQFNLMYRNGNTYSVCNDKEEERTGWKVISHNTVPGPTELTIPPGFSTRNDISGEAENTMYCEKRSADKWLLISAEMFQRNRALGPDSIPSFDMNIRNHYTYFANSL